MNEALKEAFRHNSWATRELLSFCRELPDEQLDATSVGTYGTIRSTLNHIIKAEGRYARRLAGEGPHWADPELDIEDELGVEEMLTRLAEIEPLWDKVLSSPLDAERVLVIDRGANEVRAGVYVAQALHHGNSHREQVCTILTSLEIEPPDLQAWAYADATGRIWSRA